MSGRPTAEELAKAIRRLPGNAQQRLLDAVFGSPAEPGMACNQFSVVLVRRILIVRAGQTNRAMRRRPDQRLSARQTPDDDVQKAADAGAQGEEKADEDEVLGVQGFFGWMRSTI